MAGTRLTEKMNNSIRLAEAIHRLAGIFFPQEISANSHQLVQDLPDKPDKPTPGGAERGLHPGGLDLSGSSSSLAYAKLYSAHYYSTLCYYVPHSGYAESPTEGAGHNCGEWPVS